MQQGFCSSTAAPNFVVLLAMKGGKAEVLEAGAWLRAERDRRGKRCATRLVAALATMKAKRAGDPVIIHQQQLSAIEGATPDKGPAKLPSWWRHVRALFESGELDDALASPIQMATAALDMPHESDELEEVILYNAAGTVIGRLTLKRGALQ